MLATAAEQTVGGSGCQRGVLGTSERLEVAGTQAQRQRHALTGVQRCEHPAIVELQLVGDAAHGPTIIRRNTPAEVRRCLHRRNPSSTVPA